MKLTPAHVESLRHQFPALQRTVDGKPAVFLDGPAGTQVPQRVIDAIGNYLSTMNANHGGLFATSVESDRLLDEAHQAFADFLGASDLNEIAFGANMTSLTFALSRSIACQWQPGDEVVVTRLDHDANVAPWVMAAEDRGATVKYVDFDSSDCTLSADSIKAAIGPRTRLVALGAASNASGSINPIKETVAAAHAVGAWVFVDAVHFAPHALIDVADWGCDFLACSAYKFFGPHVGIMWGKREHLEALKAYKVRPAPDDLPGKWMTGTQNHEGIAGALEAVEYLADIGRMIADQPNAGRRPALIVAWQAIREYETALCDRLLAGLKQIPGIRVRGIDDPARIDERLPTVSITHDGVATDELARLLGEEGIFVWNGHYYAIQITECLGLEPQGMIRIGLAHYNTVEEVDRLLETLQAITRQLDGTLS